MRYFIFVIIIILPLYTFSDEIKSYEQAEEYSFKIGNHAGEIGYDPQRSLMGGAPAGPTSFTISPDLKFYICDTINFRINIYDCNYKYLQCINNIEYGYIHAAFLLKVNANSNVLVLDGSKNLIKFNSKNEMIYFIWSSQLPNEVKSKKNFFNYYDKVLYYEKNDKFLFLNEFGKKINQEEAEKELIKIQQNFLQYSSSETIPVKKSIISEFVQNNKIITYENNLLTSNFSKHRAYYETIEENRIKSNSVTFGDKIDLNKLPIGQHKLIGFDSDGNSYWGVKTGRNPEDRAVLVCSQYGEALDCFYNRIKWSSIAVAPSGDVYFMNYDTMGTHIYKTSRRW